MEKILFHLLVLMMSLDAGGYGLEFNFTLLPSADLFCGTLICFAKNSPAPGADLHQNSLLQGNISSMVIFFKTTVATLDAKGQTMHNSPIASLNDEMPSVTYVSDKVNVNGHLEPKQATMQIELVNEEDCRAEFTCQITVLDLQGKNTITTSRVLQQSRPDKNETGVADRLGHDSMYLLLQQMSNKIVSMGKIIQYQQETFDSWKRSLQHRMEYFETNPSNKMRVLNEELSFLRKENRSQGFPVGKEKEQNGTGHTSPSQPVETESTSTVTVGPSTQEYSVTTFAPILHPKVPLIVPIKGGFYPGKKIHITGTPDRDFDRFQINLICGQSPDSDRALHFDVRFRYSKYRKVIVRNTRLRGHYGKSETDIPYFPFSRGHGFDMVLLCESDSIKMIINNKSFINFEHRILPRKINHLHILGDVDISAIKFG